MAKTVTTANLPVVLGRFISYALSLEKTTAKREFCKDFNSFLDFLGADDAFGTEGQCDPRGDQRG